MALQEGKVFDLDKMEIVDAPVKEEKASTTEVETEEKEDPDPAETEEEEKVDPAAEEEEEKEEKEPAEEEKEEEKKDKVEEPQAVDDYIKEKYSEMGIESEADLDEQLAAYTELQTKYKSLEEEISALKESEGKPKFSSTQEEKAFEFLKEFDITRMGEGMQTLARVVTMDLDSADPRIILEEKFILDHPELTREESLRKFSRDYKKKYTAEKESFDTEEAYNEEMQDLKIEEKSAVAKAKEYLAKKQKEFKSAPKEAAADIKSNPVVQTNIQKNVSALDGYIKTFDSITYAPTNDEKDNFPVKFNKGQLKAIHNAAKEWVSNPMSYDADGTVTGGFDPDQSIVKIAYLLYGEDILAKMYAHVTSQADIKRAEKIATIKPNRVAKTVVEKVSGVSEEKQWDMMVRKKKAERSNRAPTY